MRAGGAAAILPLCRRGLRAAAPCTRPAASLVRPPANPRWARGQYRARLVEPAVTHAGSGHAHPWSRGGGAAGTGHVGAAGAGGPGVGPGEGPRVPRPRNRGGRPGPGVGLGSGSGDARGRPGLVPEHQQGGHEPPWHHSVPSRFPGRATNRHCSPTAKGRASISREQPPPRGAPKDGGEARDGPCPEPEI